MTASSNTNLELLNDLDELKRICEQPRLYLTNYFAQLRTQVDKEIVSKQLNQQDEKKKSKLNEIWQHMIEAIGCFERNCIKCDSFQVMSYAEEITDLKHKNLKQTIQMKVNNNLKRLFKNKTIAFVNINDELMNGKLIIVNDQFISLKTIDGSLLNDELIKAIELRKMLENDGEYVLELNLCLENLEILDLKCRCISLIDSNAFKDLGRLKKLKLVGNNLTKLQSNTFKSLNNLQSLELYYNKIMELNSGVFDGLQSLEQLALGSNQLTEVEIDKIETNLSNNKINELNANVFQGLNNLQELYLAETHIQKINEKAFNGLKSLKKLDLNFNQISQLDSFTFEGLESLRHLSLGSNQISELNVDCFAPLTKLLSLDLWSNKINGLKANVFQGLFNLQCLDLRNNDLNEIDVNAFNDIQSLKKLDLRHNQLKELNVNVFHSLIHIQDIYLPENIINHRHVKEFEQDMNKISEHRLNSNNFNNQAECLIS